MTATHLPVPCFSEHIEINSWPKQARSEMVYFVVTRFIWDIFPCHPDRRMGPGRGYSVIDGKMRKRGTVQKTHTISIWSDAARITP